MRKLRVKDLLFAFTILFLLGIIVGMRLQSANPPAVVPPAVPAEAATAELARLSQAFVAIAQSVTPAVVNINCSRIIRGRTFRDPFWEFFGFGWEGLLFKEPDRKAESLGSGVIVSPEGYVLTNHHVIDIEGRAPDEIVVTLNDKREYTAQVVGVDPASDLAVLKLPVRGLPVVPWGDSDRLQVGEWVVAIGSPFGFSQTVTAGIVSAKGRSDVGISDYENFIQTDAAINPGNSGGALINLQGRLVGINTAIISQSGGYQGIGFAIPSNLARKVMALIIRDGFVIRGWIGIVTQPLTSEVARRLNLKTTAGVMVQGVYRKQPAHRAGVLPGDLITHFNGLPVQSPGHLRNLVADAPVGSMATLTLLRNGRKITVRVGIQRHPIDRRGRLVPGI
ncbi:MAG TPA: trypsin-like serine protease [Armatimonadetes bacterium]|nr:trypsin-like serine protease [Armatimonadota bacterium]